MPVTPRSRQTRATRAVDPHDELTRLPGVGQSIAGDLRSLGVRSIPDLARRNPERLYGDLCRKTGERQDPCVLYAFRCAVYAASVPGPEPHLLKWWNWKGRTLRPWARHRVRPEL
jgi:hypothetical protein